MCGKFGNPIFLFDADYNIATTPIVDIIGKSTYGMHNRFRIPACFEFYSVPLDSLSRDKIVDVYW